MVPSRWGTRKILNEIISEIETWTLYCYLKKELLLKEILLVDIICFLRKEWNFMCMYVEWKIEWTYVIRTLALLKIEEEQEMYQYIMNWHKLEWILKLLCE